MCKVLMLSAKWCDGNPSLGLSSDFHNVFNSFRQSYPNIPYYTLFYDESVVVYSVHINDVLKDFCNRNGITTLIVSLMGNSPLNPSIDVLHELTKEGYKICIVWPDTGPSWGMQTMASIGDKVTLHISWDNPRSNFHDTTPRVNNYLNLWTPEDKTLFRFLPFDKKDIDVSFLGSTDKYQDRLYFLNHLKGNKNIFISGGQRDKRLTAEQYADITRRSKIGLNFALSQTGVFWQAKGRILEYTMCGGMLLDMANPSTEDFFTPGVDFINFIDIQDLLNKINYYLSNNEERNRIAMNGYNKCTSKYSSFKYWEAILKTMKSI